MTPDEAAVVVVVVVVVAAAVLLAPAAGCLQLHMVKVSIQEADLQAWSPMFSSADAE